MKKILPALLLATILPLSVLADKPAETNDGYIGLKIHKNANMAINMSTNTGASGKVKEGPFGIGVNFGSKIGDFARIEGEIGYGGGIRVESYGETDTFTASSAMFNGYLEYEVLKGFSPYIGAGLGLGLITGELDAYGYAINIFEAAATLSYQIMLGANFALSDKFDINVGFKYQDYGQLEMGVYSTKFKFDVDATEFYAGFAYKVSWK
jgi:opacity protein-like surface antigen